MCVSTRRPSRRGKVPGRHPGALEPPLYPLYVILSILGLLPAHWTLTSDGDPPTEAEFDVPAGAPVVHVELP